MKCPPKSSYLLLIVCLHNLLFHRYDYMCDYLKLTAFDCRLGGFYFQDGRMILISEMALISLLLNVIGLLSWLCYIMGLVFPLM